MRSQPSVFVNCDKCDREIEILLDDVSSLCDGDQLSFENQINKELKNQGWLFGLAVDIVNEGELCPKCGKERESE